MELFHGSNQEITEISDSGVFGGIFGTASESSARSHGSNLYVIESPRHLEDYELNYEIDGAWEMALEVCNGDEAIAEAIMKPGCDSSDFDDPDGEMGWEFQRLRGELAKKLGYTSVEMEDEHGATTLCLPGCLIKKY